MYNENKLAEEYKQYGVVQCTQRPQYCGSMCTKLRILCILST